MRAGCMCAARDRLGTVLGCGNKDLTKTGLCMSLFPYGRYTGTVVRTKVGRIVCSYSGCTSAAKIGTSGQVVSTTKIECRRCRQANEGVRFRVWGVRMHLRYTYMPISGGERVRRVVQAVHMRRVAGGVGRVYVRTGRFLSPSVTRTVGYTRGGRRTPLKGRVLRRLRRGLGVTKRSVVPVYRSAKVTMMFLRVKRSIRLRKKTLRSTMGRKMHRNCMRNCLHGSIIKSPLVHRGAGSGAPTILRAEVMSKSRMGVGMTPGNFKDRGVDHMFVLGPTRKVRNMGSTILATMGSTKPGTYPPVIINIKVNNAFRGYTLVTGRTLAHRIKSRSRVRCMGRLRRRLLAGVGGLNVKPNKLKKAAATLTIGVGACPARVTKLPITIGVYYRMGHRIVQAVWFGELDREKG